MYREPKYAKLTHYSYQTVHIPENNGNKLFLYYKRYTPKGKLQNLIQEGDSLYQAFQQFKKADPAEQKQVEDLDKILPVAKTLMVVNFDHDFEEKKVKKWFQLIGKVRKVELGKYKNSGGNKEHKNSKFVYFALVVFKNEFDLVKVFDEGFLQEQFDEYFKQSKMQQNKDDKNGYLNKLLNTYEKQQLDEKTQAELDKQRALGFNVVTDYKGDIDFNRKTINDMETDENKQKKKKKILPQFKNDFYQFQTNKKKLADIYGDDVEEDGLTDKQFIARKKAKLAQSFQKDVQKLKELKNQKQQQQTEQFQKPKIQFEGFEGIEGLDGI